MRVIGYIIEMNLFSPDRQKDMDPNGLLQSFRFSVMELCGLQGKGFGLSVWRLR